jgi:hypothetical protein
MVPCTGENIQIGGQRQLQYGGVSIRTSSLQLYLVCCEYLKWRIFRKEILCDRYLWNPHGDGIERSYVIYTRPEVRVKMGMGQS